MATLMSWATHCYNGRYNGLPSQKAKTNPKIRPQFGDCEPQLARMKLESLVIADQNAAVNTFSSPVLTARHTKGSRECLKFLFGGTRVSSVTRVKS